MMIILYCIFFVIIQLQKKNLNWAIIAVPVLRKLHVFHWIRPIQIQKNLFKALNIAYSY